jgi:MFS family permease
LSLAWFIWGLGALFYLMAFFQRVAPAVMTDELMRDFQISAAALGNLSAFYFYSYVAMQIPTGIIADLWGPRRLLASGALVAGLGILLFALSPAFLWAAVGRFLVGGAVAVAFVALLKVAGRWFQPRYFGLISGLTLLSGLCGAIFAGPPLRLLMDHFSWRGIMLASALVTFGLAAAIWLLVRDHPHEKGYRDLMDAGEQTGPRPGLSIKAGLIEVFRYRNTWLLFIIPGGTVGCLLTFAGLWGVPFLTTHYGLATHQAATFTSLLLLAWGLGGPVLGWLSDRLGARKALYLGGTAVALAGWTIIVFMNHLPHYLLLLVMGVTGFSSGSMIISFAFGRESVPPALAGTVSGVINTGVMLGPMILQPAVGWVLDRQWQGELANGVRIFSLDAYRHGFTLMLGWLSLSFLLLLFTRETGARPRS